MADEVWTLLALKEYIEQRFNDQGVAINAALSAAERAVNKAESATEKRFEGVNEFRKTLSDQAMTFLTKGEYFAQHKALEEKVMTISGMQNMMVGALIFIAFAEPIVGAIIEHFWK
jgi:hypothetical protein